MGRSCSSVFFVAAIIRFGRARVSMLRATITEQQEKMLEDQQELRIRTGYSMKKTL
jgi:hypothetical protein